MPTINRKRICTHEPQCEAPSHFSDCKSMPSAGDDLVLVETQDGFEVWTNVPGEPRVALFAQEEDARRFLGIGVAATPAEGGWRDMDSAPKDSTWILGKTLAGRQVVVRWGGGAWEDDNHLCRYPIRWQPLPPST